MDLPGFRAEASIYRSATPYFFWASGHAKSFARDPGEASRFPQAASRSVPQILPQLGFGVGGIGVTYPPSGDDCYCCLQWIRCPCGLSFG